MAAITPSVPEAPAPSVATGRTLVVGGTGLLGRALLRASGPGAIGTWHQVAPSQPGRWYRLDLRDPAAIRTLVYRVQPTAIVNAAYARGGDDLTAVTAVAPGLLAEAATAAGIAFTHLSTDVVFAGDRQEPYVESDPMAPVHDYGRAKARAEATVAAAAPRALIVRTSLLYGHPYGVQEQLVRGARTGTVSFFTDEIRAPVHVDDLAAAILMLIEAEVEGVVHLAGADAVDRLSFARLLAPHVGVDPSCLSGRESDPSLIRPRRVVLRSERSELASVTALPGCHARLSSTGPPSDRD